MRILADQQPWKLTKAQPGVRFWQRGVALSLLELLAAGSEQARFRVMRCNNSKDMILIDRCVFLFAAI